MRRAAIVVIIAPDMPPFPRPRTSFDYDVDAELAALREHKQLRAVPKRGPDRLLLCTWNVANFGVQKRREKDHRLIAEMLGWFDLIAVQEVADLCAVRDLLPERLPPADLRSDTAGNDERTAFVYETVVATVLASARHDVFAAEVDSTDLDVDLVTAP